MLLKDQLADLMGCEPEGFRAGELGKVYERSSGTSFSGLFDVVDSSYSEEDFDDEMFFGFELDAQQREERFGAVQEDMDRRQMKSRGQKIKGKCWRPKTN